MKLPTAYNMQGQPIFATATARRVPANTEMDLPRFQKDLTALTPGNEVQLLTIGGIAKNFGNGYIGSWTAGVDQDFRDVKFNVSYVAPREFILPAVYNPNSYGGPIRDSRHSRNSIRPDMRSEDSGPRSIMTSGSHSTLSLLADAA